MILGISGATAVVASAQPAATLGGPVQTQAPARAAVLPDEQPAKGCAFSAPGTGPFSQNICWIDMSTLDAATAASAARSEEHTSELQSLMRNSYAVFCLKKKTKYNKHRQQNQQHRR